MACRNLEKANPKADEIRAEYPEADIEVMALDLSDLGDFLVMASTLMEINTQAKAAMVETHGISLRNWF